MSPTDEDFKTWVMFLRDFVSRVNRHMDDSAIMQKEMAELKQSVNTHKRIMWTIGSAFVLAILGAVLNLILM